MIRMKKLFTIISAAVLLCGLTAVQAAEVAPTVFEFHFVGMNDLSGNFNAAKLTGIWNRPDSTELREKVLQKIALIPEELFPSSFKNKHSLIQPLLDDLLRAESIVQLLETTNQQLQLNIAVRLDQE